MALRLWIFFLLGTNYCTAQRRAANADLPHVRTPTQVLNFTGSPVQQNADGANRKGGAPTTIGRPQDPKGYGTAIHPSAPPDRDKRREEPSLPGASSNSGRDYRNEPAPPKSSDQKGSVKMEDIPERAIQEEKLQPNLGKGTTSVIPVSGVSRTDTYPKSDNSRPGVDRVSDRDTRRPRPETYIPSERDRSREGSSTAKGDMFEGRDRTAVDSYSRRDDQDRYPPKDRVDFREDSYPIKDPYDSVRPSPHPPSERDRYDKGRREPEPYPVQGGKGEYRSEEGARKGVGDYDRTRYEETYPVPPPQSRRDYPKGEYYEERRRFPSEEEPRREVDRKRLDVDSYPSRDRKWEGPPPRKEEYDDRGYSRGTHERRDEYDRRDRTDACTERGGSRTTRCQDRREYTEENIAPPANRRVYDRPDDRAPARSYDERRLPDKEGEGRDRERYDREGERYRPSIKDDRRETVRPQDKEPYDPRTSYRSNPATYDETSPTGIGRPDNVREKGSSSVGSLGASRPSSRDSVYPKPPLSSDRGDVYAKGSDSVGRDEYYRSPAGRPEYRDQLSERRYDDELSRRDDRYPEVDRPPPRYDDRGRPPSRYADDSRPVGPPEDTYRRGSDSPPRREQTYDRDYRPARPDDTYDRRYSPESRPVDPDDRDLQNRRSDVRRDERPLTTSRDEGTYDRRPSAPGRRDDVYERRPAPARSDDDDAYERRAPSSRRPDDAYERPYPARRPGADMDLPPRRDPVRGSEDTYDRGPPPRRSDDDYDREGRPVRRYDDTYGRDPPVRTLDDTSYRGNPPARYPDDSYDRRPPPPTRRTDYSYDRERPPDRRYDDRIPPASSSEDISYRRGAPPIQPTYDKEPPPRPVDDSYARRPPVRGSEGTYDREPPPRRYQDDDYDREPLNRRAEDAPDRRPLGRSPEDSYSRDVPSRDSGDRPLQARPLPYDRDSPSRRGDDTYDRGPEPPRRTEDTYDRERPPPRRPSIDTYPVPPPDTSRRTEYATPGRDEDYPAPSRRAPERTYTRDLPPIERVDDYNKDARLPGRPDDVDGRRLYSPLPPEDTLEKDGRRPSPPLGPGDSFSKGSLPSPDVSSDSYNGNPSSSREYSRGPSERRYEQPTEKSYVRATGFSSDRSSEKGSNARNPTVDFTKGSPTRYPNDNRNSSQSGDTLKGDPGQRRATAGIPASNRREDSVSREQVRQKGAIPSPVYRGPLSNRTSQSTKGLPIATPDTKYPAGSPGKRQEQPEYRSVPVFKTPKEIIDAELHLRNPTKSPATVVTEVHYPVFIPQKGEGEVISQKDRRGTIKDT